MLSHHEVHLETDRTCAMIHCPHRPLGTEPLYKQHGAAHEHGGRRGDARRRHAGGRAGLWPAAVRGAHPGGCGDDIGEHRAGAHPVEAAEQPQQVRGAAAVVASLVIWWMHPDAGMVDWDVLWTRCSFYLMSVLRLSVLLVV